ncbi:MAG: site-specific integrase [Bdellovibrionales bacterium]|nr:site-specific integrase [Bdellovibrionales bacterium]
MAISSYQKDGNTFWKIYLNLRSPLDPTVRGQRVVRGIESEKAALAEEKKLLRELSSELSQRASQGITWEALLERWELAMRSKDNETYAWSTVVDYISCVSKWTGDWFKMPAAEITKADGRLVLEKMRDEGRTKGYIKYLQGIVSVIYRWGIENRLVKGASESPVRGIKLEYRHVEKEPEILTIEEMKKLLREAKALENPWYPIWAMALLTGMRNGELYALTWSDVDFKNQRIVVSKTYYSRGRYVKDGTKSGKWRWVPISTDLMELLKGLQKEAGNREHVLPRLPLWDKGGQAVVLRRFCKGIGIRPVRFHALRACFATQLLANDVAPARVMKVCGWQDIKTMQHYVRLAGVDERGATESLKVLPSDQACMDQAAEILDLDVA